MGNKHFMANVASLSQNLKNKFQFCYLWRYRISVHKILNGIRKDILPLSLLIILQSSKNGNKNSLWSVLLLLLKIIGYLQLPKYHLPVFLTVNTSIISVYVRFMHLSVYGSLSIPCLLYFLLKSSFQSQRVWKEFPSGL